MLTHRRVGWDLKIITAAYGPFALILVWFLNDPRLCPSCKSKLKAPETSSVVACPICNTLIAWVKMTAGQRLCKHCQQWISRPNSYASDGIIVCPFCTKILAEDRCIMTAVRDVFGDRIDFNTLLQQEQLATIAIEQQVPIQHVIDQVRRYIISKHDGTQHRPI